MNYIYQSWNLTKFNVFYPEIIIKKLKTFSFCDKFFMTLFIWRDLHVFVLRQIGIIEMIYFLAYLFWRRLKVAFYKDLPDNPIYYLCTNTIHPIMCNIHILHVASVSNMYYHCILMSYKLAGLCRKALDKLYWY